MEPRTDLIPATARWGVRAAFAMVFLLALISLAGILLPSTYARETANWAAQAVGQDWFDLLIAVPWLALCAARARRGSRAALLLLAGGALYATYELVIYAFAIRFNALFLVYCAALGLSLFTLVAIVAGLQRQDPSAWFGDRMPVRTTGGLLIGIGVVFSLLWLADIVPALIHGAAPASVAAAGVPTNPVHVIDLSVILPAHLWAGVLVLRRRPAGYLAAPVLLSFGTLMGLSIAGMMVVMRLRGEPASAAVVAAMVAVGAVSALVLVRALRALRGESPPS